MNISAGLNYSPLIPRGQREENGPERNNQKCGRKNQRKTISWELSEENVQKRRKRADG